MNISLIIPSRNNLKYLQCAYNSIRKYLPPSIEIVLLDDASTDKTWEWMCSVKSIDLNVQIYKNDTNERVGHTVLYDKGVELATNDIFGIFHADMIATPNYVQNMLKNLKEHTVVSGTRIEPPLHPPGPEKYVKNFGMEPEEFNYTEFLKFVDFCENDNKDKTSDGIFAPWIMYKKDFLEIQGHDKKLFAPMELEDSDLFNRFLLNNYKLIQSRDAMVYHMTCRGSRFKDGVKIINEIQLDAEHVWKRAEDSKEYKDLREIKFREWWRKWHSDVLHDENMLPIVRKRYDIGFVVKNANLAIVEILEPWTDTIYIENNELINTYVQKEQKQSNFNIKSKVKNINEIKLNDILIEFDAKYLNNNNFNFIKELSQIIESTNELGIFEFDIFKITIKSLNSYESFLIKNDTFYEKFNLL
jgi:glycosyltransferase involved in cell wall biosynthesis